MPGFLACFSFWWWCQVTFPCFRTGCPTAIQLPAGHSVTCPALCISHVWSSASTKPELVTVKFLSHSSDWPNFPANLL